MDKRLERAARLEELLPRVIRNLFRVEQDDAWVELPVGQVRVLRMLFGGPSTPSELSHSLGLSVSAITQVVSRLEAQGYVTRSEDIEDRRIRRLKLSHEGQVLMLNRRKARVRQAAQVLSCLSDERQDSILTHLQELAEAGNQTRGFSFEPLRAEMEHPLPPLETLPIKDTA